MNTKKIGLGIVSLAAVGAMAMPAMAQEADTGTDEPTTQELQEDETSTSEDRAAARAERKQARIDALADELGISSEELEAAMDAVRADFQAERLERLEVKLDEKVAAGELTQEQADEILADAENGDWPKRGKRGHRGHHRHGGGDASSDAATDATAEQTSV